MTNMPFSGSRFLSGCIAFVGGLFFAATTVLAQDVPVPLPKPMPDLKTEIRQLSGELEAAFHSVMDEYKVPGGAFVLVEHDRIIRLSTRGVRQKGQVGRVDSETVFPLASVSKTFAGTLTAILVDEQAFSLKDPILQYVPDLKVRTRGHVERIKVSHLLSHSTGLVPNAYDNLLDAGQTLEVILPKYSKVKPICAPGTCYGYQNIFFSLIEPVIEQSAGDDYADLVRARLLEPLGMDRASVGFGAVSTDTNAARPHVYTRRSGWVPRKHRKNYYEVLPAAGINASISDLALWLEAHMGTRPDVLSADQLAIVRTPMTRTSREKRRRFWKDHLTDADYGLGWRLCEFSGEPLVYHGGGIQGFRSSVAYAPELGIGIAVLMNAESRAIDDLNTRFWDAVFSDKRLQAAVRIQNATDGR